MVMEEAIQWNKIEQKRYKTIFMGFLYATVSIFLSLLIFKSNSSMVMVFLTAIAALPFIYYEIMNEEKKDITNKNEHLLLKEHAKILESFIFLFIGATISFTVWYVLLRPETITTLFQHQSSTIQLINTNVTGFTWEALERFSRIFFNNVRVLFFCILFSFIYGSGAIFILIWNSSVIGAAIGNVIRSGLSKYAEMAGLERVGMYFHTVGYGVLRYIIHGIPEITAYFVAGLAGGIISVAIIRHDFKSRNFEQVILDSADLIIISIVLLFIAAILEVWVTPLLF